MRINNLPGNYAEWFKAYNNNLQINLLNSSFTKDLFKQYKKHLGLFRYLLLIDIQRVLVPAHVNNLLRLGQPAVVQQLIPLYRIIRKFPFHKYLILAMVPGKFKPQVRNMDQPKNVAPALHNHSKLDTMIEHHKIKGKDVWVEVSEQPADRANARTIPTEYFTAKYYLGRTA